MTYQYRVTLSGIKGFFSVYKVNAENTLYSFHKQMMADMEFAPDQVILFKGLDTEGSVLGRFGLIDLGCGAVDDVTIGSTVKNGISSFVYFYDVTNKKSVIITLEGEIPDPTKVPTLIDSKGPDPIDFENVYVAFEDLPEDQRHLPGDSKKKKNPLEAILGDVDDEDLDDEENEDDEDDEEDDSKDEDAVEIYDGSEELTL